MTAIAGIWSLNGGIPTASSCHEMLQALSIYGPDHRVQHDEVSFSMGLCLLRLLPEDCFDRQPLSADGVTALIADVRLDNREELARALGLSAERLATMADSEVLLLAWLRWREGCVDHLSGAFSFAAWNHQEQHLFLARSGPRRLVA